MIFLVIHPNIAALQTSIADIETTVSLHDTTILGHTSELETIYESITDINRLL